MRLTKTTSPARSSKWMPVILMGLLCMLLADVWLLKKYDLLSDSSKESKTPDAYWRQTIEKKKLLEGYLESQVQSSLDSILGKDKAVVRISVAVRMQEESYETVEYNPQKMVTGRNYKTDTVKDGSSDEERNRSLDDLQKKTEKQLREAIKEASDERNLEGTEKLDSNSSSAPGYEGGGSNKKGDKSSELPGLLTSPENSYIDQDLPGFPKVFTYDENGNEVAANGVGSAAFGSSGTAKSSAQRGGETSSSKESLETPSTFEHTQKDKDAYKGNHQVKESVVQAGNEDTYVMNSTKYKKVVPPGEILHLSINLAVKDSVLARLGQNRYDLERYVKNMVGFDPARKDTFVLIPYSQTSFAEKYLLFWHTYRIAILVACGIIFFMIMGIFGVRAYGNYRLKKQELAAEAAAAAKAAEFENKKAEAQEQEAQMVEEQEKLKAKREAILQLAQEDLEAFAKMLDSWVSVEVDV